MKRLVGGAILNAFVMIFSVIFAAVLLFMGAALERYIAYFRTATAAVVASLIGMAFISDATTLHQMLEAKGSIGEFWTFITTTSSGIGTAVLYVVPLLFIVLTCYLQYRLPHLMSLVSTLVWGTAGAMAMQILIQMTLAANAQLVLAVIVGVLALISHLLFQNRYLIITSAVVGGSLIAVLFSRFYYLPVWFTTLLGIILIALGLSTQEFSYRKQKRNKRVLDGDEPA